MKVTRKEKEITVVEVVETVTCPRCGKAEMESTGVVYTCCPEKYEHKCPECGYTDALNKTYPRVFLDKK